MIYDHTRVAFTPRMDWTLRQIRPAHAPIRTLFPFDLETFLIQPGQTAPRMVCMSSMLTFADRPHTADSPPSIAHANPDLRPYDWCPPGHDRAILHNLARCAIPDRHALLVGANVSFDLLVLANEFPDLLPLIFDALDQDRVVCVQLAQRLMDTASNQLDGFYGPDGVWFKHNYSLAGLAKRHLGLDMDKDTWRLRYGTLWDVPIAQWEPGAIDYSVGDAVVTGAVWQAELDGSPLSAPPRVGPELSLIDLFRQTRAQFWLALMVARGFRVDPIAVASLKALVERERDQVFARLREAGLVRVDGKRDVKAAAARMTAVAMMHGRKPKMTGGGEKSAPTVALDEDACIESGDGLLADYASYTSLTTILTKDIGALEEPAARGLPIQSRFETLLETGRTSCSGGGKGNSSTYSYQLQNPRRKLGIKHLERIDPKIDDRIGVRQCFVPRPGFVLSSNDFSMFEACSWSQASIDCGVPIVRMIDALNAGRDVHLELAAKWLGTTYDDVYARRKEPAVKEARQRVKPGTFGFMGGMGALTFVLYAKNNYQVIFTLPEAKKIKRAWLDTWEPQAWFDFIARLVGEADTGEVVHVRSHRRRAWVPYTVASNSFFQGLAADCAKDAGYEVSREMFLGIDRRGRRSPLEGSRVVNFVHDEFICEHPIHIAHEAAHRVAEIMFDASKRWMPDVPSRVEPALMERWIKSAEARYVNGRLVPWVPT